MRWLPATAPALATLLFGSSLRCDASDEGVDAALALADSVPVVALEVPRTWTLKAEAMGVSATRRGGESVTRGQLALDGLLHQRLGPSWQAVVAGRVDLVDYLDPPASVEFQRTTALLKEGYLSWQPTSSQILDVGRVNLRHGVALGYNPTDFFKAGAVDIDSPLNLQSRRDYRIGSVMLRGQQLWADGALSLQLSPRLAEQREPGDPEASDSLSRTNSIDRWLLSGSHQLSGNLRPQWLLYGERGHAPQFGLNLSTLLGDATVVYAEWAGGRSPSQVALAAGTHDDQAFRSRSALGFTYSFPSDLSLTLEWQTNGAGVTAAQAQALAFSDPRAWGQTLRWAGARQESVTRHTLFSHVRWRNAMVHNLDISGYLQTDTDDGGKQYWLELRRRFDHVDLSLQWQRQIGDSWTRFGALPEQGATQLLAEIYF